MGCYSDDEEIPCAISPSEEVEDDDEEEEPARKKQKRRSGGDFATASSPAKDADFDLEEAGMSSSGVRSQDNWDGPMAAPPVSSAPPRGFLLFLVLHLVARGDGGRDVLIITLLLHECRLIMRSVFWERRKADQKRATL